MMELLRAKALHPGDTIGVFTPASPSYQDCEGLFANGVRNLERLGFRVKLGSLTAARASQGYRSGSPEDRAREFMDLIRDPDVRGMISTIGGTNSSSLIPFLDFQAIRESRKVICGYSDITSLHLSILKYAGLRTFYGPGVMTWFGDWPDGVPESSESFLDAVSRHLQGSRHLAPPVRWSNHRRNWSTGEWKTVPREWQASEGWRTLVPGRAEAPIVAANLNTLLTAAGTPYFPDTRGKILLVESMAAAYGMEERHLRQLQLMGVLDGLAGLIVGKPEWPDSQEAPFTHNELILEVVGKGRGYPVVSEFDCGHTLPMLTIGQMTPVRLEAREGFRTLFELLEPMVCE
jgi:muramoyltetrapeptide carboxypeptidase LdcA involved in peptidoglycan recycling